MPDRQTIRQTLIELLEADTLNAGQFLFDRGFYVQSVTFPAVPYHAGVLRIQVNANHRKESIDELVAAMGALHAARPLPGPEQLPKLPLAA